MSLDSRLRMPRIRSSSPSFERCSEQVLFGWRLPAVESCKRDAPSCIPRLTTEWLLAEDVDENGRGVDPQVSRLLDNPRPDRVGGSTVRRDGIRGDGDQRSTTQGIWPLPRSWRAAHRMPCTTRSFSRPPRRRGSVPKRRQRSASVSSPSSATTCATRSRRSAWRRQILSRSGLAAREEGLVNRIQVSANRMTRMIAQILDFARIRAGMSFELKFKSANLHEICSAVVDELRMSRPDQRIELDVEGNGDAMCDADRIAQVLSNIIGNAIQHGTSGPISVTVRDAAPDAVAIAVHNFGPPIPEVLKQASSTHSVGRRPTGDGRMASGSGCSSRARSCVRTEGRIAVRSPDRDGTTFTVVLPRRPAS